MQQHQPLPHPSIPYRSKQALTLTEFNYFADSSLLLSNVAWINLGFLANWLSVLITPIYGIMAQSNGIKMHWLLFSVTQSRSQWQSPAVSMGMLHLSFLDFRVLSQKPSAFSTIRENINFFFFFYVKQEHKQLKQNPLLIETNTERKAWEQRLHRSRLLRTQG